MLICASGSCEDGRTPTRASLSTSDTHRQVCVHVHVHLCTSMHAAHTCACTPVQSMHAVHTHVMHTCAHLCMRRTHTCTHPCAHPCMRRAHTCMDTCVIHACGAHTRACTPVRIHACGTHTCMHTCAHPCVWRTHVCMHTCAHPCMWRTHVHAHSHTRCTAAHTRLHTVSALVWLTRSHTRPSRPPRSHPHTWRSRGGPSAPLPLPRARLGQMPIFKGRADGPTALLPRGPRPSTSAEGPGQQLCCQHHPGCAQSQPLPPKPSMT